MILLVWYGYLAISKLVKDNGHISIEYFYSLANKVIQKYLDVFVCILLIIFSILMVKFGFEMVSNSIGKNFPASHLPRVILNLPILISGLIIVVFSVNNILKILLKYEVGGED
ncbi:Tripartite ATP-independent transporter, DctQ component [Lentibacillus persicus]|uniref:Tripartite ATP-independent transporter, DctQ component n=2 Tax=Lentibacillus persicus TaxID=640948 RepID=A0A1I1YT87_9BACI|nr:Tripartite ATP-independent transporter, DctQ component [Lentibacillus persicus]